MTDIIMRKRAASRAGEVGLFVSQEISEEDFRILPTSRDLIVTASTARNVTQLAKTWVLAQKIADACEWLGDKESAMVWLKLKSRHAKLLTDPETGEVALVPKSIAFASLPQEGFNRIFNRMIYVTMTEIIPGIDEKALRASVEEMIT